MRKLADLGEVDSQSRPAGRPPRPPAASSGKKTAESNANYSFLYYGAGAGVGPSTSSEISVKKIVAPSAPLAPQNLEDQLLVDVANEVRGALSNQKAVAAEFEDLNFLDHHPVDTLEEAGVSCSEAFSSENLAVVESD